MQRVAPQLNEAIEELDFETVQIFIEHEFKPDFRITATGITIYSLLMGVDIKALENTEDGKNRYIHTLKKLKKKRPDFNITDDFGRNCFHHAASADNFLGLQFTIQVYND